MSDDKTFEYQESFGDFLRRHREASGKTLEDITRVTKVSSRYMRAFEENDSSKFPDPAFARVFLRLYAIEVGLDTDDCLQRFAEFQQQLMPTKVKDLRREMPKELALGVERAQAWDKWLWVGLGSGVLVLVIILVIRGFSSSSSDEPVEVPAAAVVTESPSEKPAEATAPAATTETSPQAPAMEVPVAPSVLIVEAKEDVNFRLRLDQSAWQDLKLTVGDKKTYYIYREIEIQGVKRGALQFTYNGKPSEVSGSNIKLFNPNYYKKAR